MHRRFFSRKRIQKCRVVWCTPPCFGGSKVCLSGLQVLDHRSEIQFCFISVCARFYGRVVIFLLVLSPFIFKHLTRARKLKGQISSYIFDCCNLCVCVVPWHFFPDLPAWLEPSKAQEEKWGPTVDY